jgi:hypothetical protein
VVVLALMAVNLAVHWARPSFPYLLRALRPLFLIERLRNVRRVFYNILATVPKVANVLILLGVHVLCFSVLGYVMFAGLDGVNCTITHHADSHNCSPFAHEGCRDYFATFDNTVMQLFQLLTGEGFPIVALPAYRCRPGSVWFFVVFICIGVYMLLPLTLAVVYTTFKALMAERVHNKYARMFAGLDLAFGELTAGSGAAAAAAAPGSPPGEPTSAAASYVARMGLAQWAQQAAWTRFGAAGSSVESPLRKASRMARGPRGGDGFEGGSPSAHGKVAADWAGSRSGMEQAVPGAGGSVRRHGPASAPTDARLGCDDWLAFLAVLRPDIEEDCARRLFCVYDPLDCAGTVRERAADPAGRLCGGVLPCRCLRAWLCAG